MTKRRVEGVTDIPTLVLSLGEVWTRGVAPRLVQNSCVAGARFAIEYLRLMGIDAWATQVDALALDEKSYADILCGNEPTGWSVGALSLTTVPNAWNGHVVVETQDWFIDLTASQFDRPERGIIMGSSVCVPTDRLAHHVGVWQGDWFEAPAVRGHYLFRDAVVQKDITQAPDWHDGVTLLRETIKVV